MLLIIVAGLSYLMVSDIRMLSLKIKSLKFEENQWLFGLILLSLIISFIGILILHVYFVIIPVIILLYIIISIAKTYQKMAYKAEINVMPLKELLDPKGKAVAGSMKNLNLNATRCTHRKTYPAAH